MTLDCWFVDIAVKQNILQRIGNEGHYVLKLLLLTVPLILHLFFFFSFMLVTTYP